MTRYNNRTMKRAALTIGHLIEIEGERPEVGRDIDRIGALMEAVEVEMEHHKA